MILQTRVMAARAPAASIPGGPAHVAEFSGPIDCAVKLLKTQGPLAFYKVRVGDGHRHPNRAHVALSVP